MFPDTYRILSVPDSNFSLGATSSEHPRLINVELEGVELSLFTVKFTNGLSLGTSSQCINVPNLDHLINSNSSEHRADMRAEVTTGQSFLMCLKLKDRSFGVPGVVSD